MDFYDIFSYGDFIDQFLVSLGILYIIAPIIYGIIRLLDYINSSLCISEIAKKKGMGAVKAYIPFVRELYWHNVIGAPVWRSFFYGSWSGLFSAIIGVIMLLWMRGIVFLIIVHILYACFSVYVRYIDRHYFTENVCYASAERNDSKPTPAPAPYTGPVTAISKAKVTGVAGQMKNQTFDLTDGNEVIFGRDPAVCNIVFDQFQTSVSRRHCSIRYIASSDTYILTNYSKNGVTCNNGQPVGLNDSRTLTHGNTFSLGNGENKFFLS